jgi:hypothetical protein
VWQQKSMLAITVIVSVECMVLCLLGHWGVSSHFPNLRGQHGSNNPLFFVNSDP